jgi:hypothetical protein
VQVNVTMEEPGVHVVTFQSCNDLGYMSTERLPRARIVGPEAESDVVTRETRTHDISHWRILGVELCGTSAASNGEIVLFEELVSAKMCIR